MFTSLGEARSKYLKNRRDGEWQNCIGVVAAVLKGAQAVENKKSYKHTAIVIIVDERSFTPKDDMKLHFFVKSDQKIHHLQPGVVIAVKQMKMEEYEGKVDGRIFSENHLYVFDQKVDVPKDIQEKWQWRVDELNKWWDNNSSQVNRLALKAYTERCDAMKKKRASGSCTSTSGVGQLQRCDAAKRKWAAEAQASAGGTPAIQDDQDDDLEPRLATDREVVVPDAESLRELVRGSTSMKMDSFNGPYRVRVRFVSPKDVPTEDLQPLDVVWGACVWCRRLTSYADMICRPATPDTYFCPPCFRALARDSPPLKLTFSLKLQGKGEAESYFASFNNSEAKKIFGCTVEEYLSDVQGERVRAWQRLRPALSANYGDWVICVRRNAHSPAAPNLHVVAPHSPFYFDSTQPRPPHFFTTVESQIMVNYMR